MNYSTIKYNVYWGVVWNCMRSLYGLYNMLPSIFMMIEVLLEYCELIHGSNTHILWASSAIGCLFIIVSSGTKKYISDL